MVVSYVFPLKIPRRHVIENRVTGYAGSCFSLLHSACVLAYDNSQLDFRIDPSQMGRMDDRLIMGDDRGYRFFKVDGFLRNGHIPFTGMLYIIEAQTENLSGPKKGQKGKALK